jgi:hypothetical protein
MFDFTETGDSTWEANHYVKFKGGDCVNTSYSGACVLITGYNPTSTWNVNGDTARAYDYLLITGKTNLIDDVTTATSGKKCSAGNWFYVYKNSDCKS